MSTVFLHYNLVCPGCGSAILLPFESLVRAGHYPVTQPMDKEPVAVVCDRCRQVRNYDLAEKSQKPPWGPVVALPQISDWVCLGLLECEKAICKSRLPIFALWNPAISAEERKQYATSWIWEGLHCPNGHRIPKPK